MGKGISRGTLGDKVALKEREPNSGTRGLPESNRGQGDNTGKSIRDYRVGRGPTS